MTNNDDKNNTNDTPQLAHEEELDKAINTFQNRWKYAVFPAMIAFVIFSLFGFYLIFGMLQRMEDLSQDVSRMADTIRDSLPAMQQNVSTMSNDMHQMNGVIATSFPKLEKGVDEMSHSTADMAQTTNTMGNSIWELNQNVSKPLSMMNKMMPWSVQKNTAMPPRPSINPNTVMPARTPTTSSLPTPTIAYTKLS